MKITVVGAGAIGTLYGGRLLAGGGEVAFVARGARLSQLSLNGIDKSGLGSPIRLAPSQVGETVGELGDADVLIFAVKLYDLADCAKRCRHALKDGGLAIGLQNGVSTGEILSNFFSAEQLMIGTVYSAATLGPDGQVHAAGARNDLIIGSLRGAPHPYAEPLVAMWQRAGVTASISPDIGAVLWTKLLALATNAALTCLSRQPAGVVYHDPDLLALAERSIAEIARVAAAEGLALPPGASASALELLRGFPRHVVASMRQDLDAGRRLELDGICGTIVGLGRKHGIDTPVHEIAYACLKPYRDGGPAQAQAIGS